MDAKAYCDKMYSELKEFKVKVNKIVEVVDNLPSSEKDKLSPQASSLQDYLKDLDAKIDQLNRECPVDWGTSKEIIGQKKKQFVEEMNKLWDPSVVGGAWDGG
jgi:hypothetical protein